MLLRHVIEHVQAQNWTAIFIDLLIVVLGVFIGIQVSNWNDERAAHAKEMEFLETIRDDISQDITDSQKFAVLLSEVSGYGNKVLDSIERDEDCATNCWKEILNYFFASQWIDVRPNRATYDEVKRTGLPSDPILKQSLTRYYGLTDQVIIINMELPRYREFVRSIIPSSIQDYLWSQCFFIDGRHQKMLDDCGSPLNEIQAYRIVEELRNNDQTRPLLTYWLSTVSIVIKAMNEQIKEARGVITELDEHINSS